MHKVSKNIILLLSIVFSCQLKSQSLEKKLSIKDFIKLAESNYPAIKARQYQLLAKEKQIDINKNFFFPSLDAAVQTNLSTHNNISGMSYPQFLLPISGPPSSENSFSPVFGSAASLLFNWQAVTFGQRNAIIKEAVASSNIERADLNNEIFQHKVKIIETYLDWLIAFDLVIVNQKNVERNLFNLTQSQTLVNSGIRPGADTSLFHSELSKSKIEVMQIQQYKLTKGIQLEELLNTDISKILYDSSFFSYLVNFKTTADTNTNPLISLSKSYIDFSYAKKESIKRSTYPKLSVWGTAFTRGSGINFNGTIDATQGLLFSRFNYGAGVQLSMPLLKFKDVRLQMEHQEFILQSAKENLIQTQLKIRKQTKIAEISFLNAIAIANEMPIQLKAAKQSFDALQSRYQTGLIDLSDLLQAQYNLSKAEADVKKSQLEVWKTLLYKSAISGDLNIFLNELN